MNRFFVLAILIALALVIRFAPAERPAADGGRGRPLAPVPAVGVPASPQAGIYLPDGVFVAESWARAQIPVAQRGYIVHARFGDRPLTPMAPGLDGIQHFVNAFLVGYVPDAKVEPWRPLYVLAQGKRYQTDFAQYGQIERWQNSFDAMHSQRGDCEDHALALADWLIGLGKDARVVLGQALGGGHAWVVVREGRRTFLLEATDKRHVRRWAYPLAELHPEYRPIDMFDRHLWWENTGGATIDYVGAHWRMRATYLAKNL